MATFEQVDQILAKYNGKFAGPVYDGVHQCVAWAATYSAEIGGPSFLPTPVTGGARDIYEQFPASLQGFYNRIPNSPTFVPQKGDICVWTGMPGNQYGHISVANGVGNTSTFQSYDQNWSRGQAVTLINHNYSYFLGVLRPKNITNVEDEIMDTNKGREMYRTVFHREAESESAAAHWNGAKVSDVIVASRGSAEWQGIDATLKNYGVVTSQLQAAKDQVKSQQDQINKLSADLAAAQSDDQADADKIAQLEKELASVPEQQHQDVTDDQAAQVVAKKLNPIIEFLRKVFIGG